MGERQGELGSRIAASVVVGVLLVIALAATAASIYADGVRCDDACVAPEFAMSWSDDRDAWQWGAQLGLALVGFGAVGAGFFRVVQGRYRATAVWLAAGAATYAAWLVIHLSD